MYASDCLFTVPSPYIVHRSLATVRVSKTKYVVWKQDMNHVAILGKHSKSLNHTYNIKFIYFNISAQSGQQCPLHVRIPVIFTIYHIHRDFRGTYILQNVNLKGFLQFEF